MALYAFFLAGSNYFAPVICGFIAEYHGWQWVFYWPSVFLGITTIFLFFFMEETNYSRHKAGSTTTAVTAEKSPTGSEQGDQEKSPSKGEVQPDTEMGAVSTYSKKTFVQKLAIVGPPQPNNMIRRTWHTLYYLSWPVVFYAG